MAQDMYNVMEDYGKTGVFAPEPTPATEPAPVEEFDPDKEINAISQKFFKELDADTKVSNEMRMQLERGFISTLEEVKKQRATLQAEKETSLVKSLQARTSELAIEEARFKNEQAKKAAGYQSGLASSIKQTMFDDKLTPEDRLRQIDQLEINNNAVISANPDIKKMIDAARDQLPKRPEPLTYAQKTEIGTAMNYVKTQDDYDIVTSGDPTAVGFFMEKKKIEEKKNSDNLEERKAAEKQDRDLALSFVKSEYRFMDSKEEEELGVDDTDPNKGKYLTPESNANGRLLVQMAKGAEGIKAYDALSDADRFKMIQESRAEVAIRKLEEESNKKSDAEIKGANIVGK